jgi:hypothetical protein
LKTLRVLVSLILIALIVFGVYLFVSYILDRQIEERIRGCIAHLDGEFRTGRIPRVSWHSRVEYDDFPKLPGERSQRVLLEIMRSGEPRDMLWSALIVLENRMYGEGLDVLMELLYSDDKYTSQYTFANASRHYLVDLLKAVGEYPSSIADFNELTKAEIAAETERLRIMIIKWLKNVRKPDSLRYSPY